MAAAEVRAVLAGLRSDSAGERVAAAERAVALTDLNQVQAEEEMSAVRYHEAATALAAAGVCAPLAAMLRASHPEQQAACSALRTVFNVLSFLQANNLQRWVNVGDDFIDPGALRAAQAALMQANPS